MNEMNTVFSATDSLLYIPDGKSLLIGMENGWGRDRVELGGLEAGSVKGLLKVPKKLWDFVSSNLNAILSIANGHASRLAEAYTIQREAEAMKALAVARREQLKTAEETHDLYKQIDSDLKELRPDLTDEQRGAVFTQAIQTPLKRVADNLVGNGYQLTLDEKKADPES